MNKLFLKKRNCLRFKNGTPYWKVPDLIIDTYNQEVYPRIFSTSGAELFLGANHFVSNTGHTLLEFDPRFQDSENVESWIFDEQDKIMYRFIYKFN